MEQQNNISDVEYVGFWARVGASLIDTIILMVIITPLMYLIYGERYLSTQGELLGSVDALLNYLFPVIAVLAFWIYKSATPGKMAIHAVIVDANSGLKPSTIQYIIRYVGYIIAIIPLCLGLAWVGWDPKKQGWHDKLARTVVIRANEQPDDNKQNLKVDM